MYRMSNAVVFPSETEGRGLPIIEASASGIPIICSRYNPKKVFDDVIGRELSKDLRIQYTLFPEGRFNRIFLSDVTEILMHPATRKRQMTQNRMAVRTRYSQATLINVFERVLDRLSKLE